MITNGNERVMLKAARMTAQTKGIDQIAAFSMRGGRGKLLGAIKNARSLFGVALDFADIIRWGADPDNTKELPVIGGVAQMAIELSGGIMSSQGQYDMLMNDINAAKKQGIRVLKNTIRKDAKQQEITGIYYELMGISTETASKLLNGDFRRFDEMEDFNAYPTNPSIQILYREQTDNTDKRIYIIEAFFIQD